jgi:hypothetical protein
MQYSSTSGVTPVEVYVSEIDQEFHLSFTSFTVFSAEPYLLYWVL